MSLNDLIAKIKNDYKLEAEKLEKELKIKLEEENEKNEKILSDKKDEIRKINKVKEQLIIEKAKESWIIDWEQELLKAKEGKIDELFSSIKWKIVKSWKESKEVYLKLLKTITESEWEVIAPKLNTKAIEEAISESWKRFSITWKWEFKWWFIVKTQVKEYDFSLDVLMEKYIRENEEKIWLRLFLSQGD